MATEAETSLHFKFNRIGHGMRRLMDERLARYEITGPQARVLGYIGRHQHDDPPLCQKDLEIALELKGSSITSLLQGLDRKGFIARTVDPNDERRKVLTLLPKGRALIVEFDEVFREIEERIARGLTPEQRREFQHTLDLIARNLAD